MYQLVLDTKILIFTIMLDGPVNLLDFIQMMVQLDSMNLDKFPKCILIFGNQMMLQGLVHNTLATLPSRLSQALPLLLGRA